MGRANTFLNLSLLLAFATLYPGFKVLVFFILPVRIAWLAGISAILMVLASWASPRSWRPPWGPRCSITFFSSDATLPKRPA